MDFIIRRALSNGAQTVFSSGCPLKTDLFRLLSGWMEIWGELLWLYVEPIYLQAALQQMSTAAAEIKGDGGADQKGPD